MEEQQKQSSMASSVMGKISSGRVQMHSRSYFIFHAVLLVLGLILSLGFALFLVSLAIFASRLEGMHMLPFLGAAGLGLYFKSLPWLMIGAVVTMIVVLELFAERFAFAYKKPLLYSVLMVVVLVGAGGYVLARTQMHALLLRSAESGQLPIAGPFYRGVVRPIERDFTLGRVLSTKPEHVVIMTRSGQTIDVKEKFEPHPEDRDLKPNDMVLVLGSRHGNKVDAVDIKKIRDQDDLRFYEEQNKPKLEQKEKMDDEKADESLENNGDSQ